MPPLGPDSCQIITWSTQVFFAIFSRRSRTKRSSPESSFETVWPSGPFSFTTPDENPLPGASKAPLPFCPSPITLPQRVTPQRSCSSRVGSRQLALRMPALVMIGKPIPASPGEPWASNHQVAYGDSNIPHRRPFAGRMANVPLWKKTSPSRASNAQIQSV